MKKYIFSLIATLTLVNAQNSLATNGDPFSQIDKIFQMQMKQMELMQKQMDEVFKSLDKSNMPTMISSSSIISSGVQDKGDYYEVDVNVGKGNVKANVEAKDGILTIKVEEKKSLENNSSYGVVKSFSSSSFMQSFTLPKDADSKSIDYNIKDGKLIVKIKKLKNK